jgi:hypothetical protein
MKIIVLSDTILPNAVFFNVDNTLAWRFDKSLVDERTD